MQNPENDKEKVEEVEATETVDRRIFDEDGNVRDDVVEARDEAESEEELTLELLDRRRDVLESQTIEAMTQVDRTFNQVGQEMSQLTQQIRTTISDMHVRLGVLEELLTNTDLQDDRDAMAAGNLTMDRYKEIAETVVLPDMKIKAEAMQKKMQKRFEAIQAGIQDGLTPEEAVKRVDAEIQKEEEGPKIEIVSD